MYIVAGVVIAVAVVAAVLFGLYYHPTSSAAGNTLEKAGYSWEVFALQWESIAFTVSSHSTITGAFSTTYNITVYLMTPKQFENLSVTNTVSGYQWTSGSVPSANLDIAIPAGSWDIVFYDPSPIQATNVLITSSITLTTS